LEIVIKKKCDKKIPSLDINKKEHDKMCHGGNVLCAKSMTKYTQYSRHIKSPFIVGIELFFTRSPFDMP
jgi:hypothetical protein